MALRDQPYIPLYVQDFLTDEKLMECSSSATGVYIRIMCVMHKSEEYGKILLRQRDKQSDDQIKNFAAKLAKHLPYDMVTVLSALNELCQEKCLEIEGDFLIQKRMVKDGLISVIRSKSGKKGGDSTKEKSNNFAIAKDQAKIAANSENENEIISNDLINEFNEISNSIQTPKIEKSQPELFNSMMEIYKASFPAYFDDYEADYPSCISIAQKTEKLKNWASNSVLNGHMDEFLSFWREIVQYVANDDWLSSRSLRDLSTREWQRLGQHMSKPPKERTKKTKKDDNKSEYEKELEAKREAARNKSIQE